MRLKIKTTEDGFVEVRNGDNLVEHIARVEILITGWDTPRAWIEVVNPELDLECDSEITKFIGEGNPDV